MLLLVLLLVVVLCLVLVLRACHDIIWHNISL